MKLTVGNITALVSDASEDDERWLREYLAFEDAGAKFRRRFRKSGDGRLLLYNLWRHSFPAGLVSTVLRGAAEIGLAIEVVDGRARPCEPDPAADLGWLRDYQRAAVDACLKQTVGIVKSVTGSGKTEMFIALTRALPCRWLMLVHRTTLVRQAAERYELRTGEQAGIVSEGHWDDAPRFVCASFQTVLAGLRSTDAAHRARTTALLEGVQGVIVDEAHVVPAATTRAILTKAKHAYWRFGFSGTPLDRGDQRSIFAVAVLGPIIHEVNGRELVAAGVLAEPDIRLVTYKHAAGEDDGAGYAVVYQERVVEDAGRMGLVVAVAKACSKPAFLFVGRVEHGHRTVSALRAAGITSAFAWGARSTAERTDLVAALEAGVVEVLVCSVVFQEGIDIPTLRSVVNASGGKSIIAALQRLGRGMRKTADKATFEVWDVLDVGQKWLAKHSRARVQAYKREGYATKTEPVLQVDQLALDRGGSEG